MVIRDLLLGFSFGRALICWDHQSPVTFMVGTWCRDLNLALQELDRMQRVDPMLM